MGGREGRKGWVGGPLCEILNTPLYSIQGLKQTQLSMSYSDINF